ncbi:uncharacterized protein [Watersipora subatra]|uniref:uncharacterized protein n=1 Tax=Watersipora subatra TaxID=2589382 RepID=UPI00355BBB91
MAGPNATNNRIWRTFTLGCASAPHNQSACQKLKFGVPLTVAFKHDCIPVPLLNLLKYISQEGVTVPDIFRRPGNPNDQKKLVKKLIEGKPIVFSSYNFYTLASLVKKFLLSIPGGVFGADLEEKLLQVLTIAEHLKQYDHINGVIRALSRSTQHFLSLLFGVWFRIVNHVEFHSMSAEAMAKSVTGSIFLNSTGDPRLVTDAAKVMEIMIEHFAISSLFGADNLQYFADVTCSGIVVTERFTYHYKYSPADKDIQRESSLRSFAQHLRQECSSRGLLMDNEEEGKRHSCNSSLQSPLIPSQAKGGMVGCMSVPDVNTHNKFTSHLSLNPHHLDRNVSRSLSKFDSVKMKQMARLRKRSEWFLNSKHSPQPSKRLASRDSELSDGIPMDDSKSEAGSVFDDRRSVDTTLLDKPLYEDRIYSVERDGATSPPHADIETVTKHFVKKTAIVPRNSAVIPC